MLSVDAIRARILGELPGAEVEVRDTTGSNDHFEARVVSAAFEGLTMIQQHQRVYAPLRDWLATGELHALALKTYTPAAWSKASTASGGTK
jgi:acid stress-induced BolA-like protein IbaG/YrbA